MPRRRKTIYNISPNNSLRSKRCKKSMSLDMKYKIVNLSNEGMSNSEISHQLNLPYYTISNILKIKDRILNEVITSLPTKLNRKKKCDTVNANDIENLLITWINKQIKCHLPLSFESIQAKALSLFEDMKGKLGEGSQGTNFEANMAWFNQFIIRKKLQNIKIQEKITKVTDQEVGKCFKKKLNDIIEEANYSSQQIFNVDETGLFWKKMPTETFLAKEEDTLIGYEASKDKLSLLIGANAAGDFKLKPMLVYHSENPRALKGYARGSLPIIWKVNSKACVTASLFEDWFSHHFTPAVKEFCRDNDLEFKILLIIDSANCHPQFLNDLNSNIKVVFLPPNAPSWLQPMDYGVISLLKAYYLKQTFAKAIVLNDQVEGSTLREFWKSFNILDAVKIVGEAWELIGENVLNKVWDSILPQFVSTSESLITYEDDLIMAVIEMANQLDLEVTRNDVNDLLSSHAQEVTIKDFASLEKVRKEEELLTQEIIQSPNLTSNRLAEAFKHLEAAMNIFEKEDPNFARSSKVNANIFSDYVCYRDIYREKKKASNQSSADEYKQDIIIVSQNEPQRKKIRSETVNMDSEKEESNNGPVDMSAIKEEPMIDLCTINQDVIPMVVFHEIGDLECSSSSNIIPMEKQSEGGPSKMSNHSLRHIRKCSLCNCESVDEKSYFKHFLEGSSSSKVFRCCVCDFETSDNSLLLAHVSCHIKKVLFKCSDCEFQSYSESDLKCHAKNHHNDSKFKSPKTSTRSTSNLTVKSSLPQLDNTKSFECGVCGFETNSSDKLRVHVSSHIKAKLFNCFYCNYETRYKSYFKEHMAKSHELTQT